VIEDADSFVVDSLSVTTGVGNSLIVGIGNVVGKSLDVGIGSALGVGIGIALGAVVKCPGILPSVSNS
jgi:hypothetical protein